MKQKDKELLLKDLCGRLPYSPLVYLSNPMDSFDSELCTTVIEHLINEEYEVKPYLFPLSSMTEEQIEEAKTYFWKDVDYSKSLVDKGINCFQPCFNILEFYHKHHLDYRGLIPMGLALDATGLNIY